jgi:cell division GTPase FtsZ
MGRGQQAVRQYNQEILHNIQKTFGTDIDRIMVSFGAGGGSGGGGVKELIDIAKNHARYSGIEKPEKKVGVVMTLPTVGEAGSPSVRANAGKVAMELAQMAKKGEISPLIVIDNEKISRMYPNMTVKEFWPTINTTVAQLFDIFNRLSALSSPYTSFDPVDYQSIMEVGGCMIMGLTKVENYRDKFALSAAVKENLEKTLLAGGFDLATAKLAGAIVVGGKSMMANTPGLQENIDYAFDVLAGVTGQASLHRGIYEDNRETLRVYTIIGGLEAPANRFADFK